MFSLSNVNKGGTQLYGNTGVPRNGSNHKVPLGVGARGEGAEVSYNQL